MATLCGCDVYGAAICGHCGGALCSACQVAAEAAGAADDSQVPAATAARQPMPTAGRQGLPLGVRCSVASPRATAGYAADSEALALFSLLCGLADDVHKVKA